MEKNVASKEASVHFPIITSKIKVYDVEEGWPFTDLAGYSDEDLGMFTDLLYVIRYRNEMTINQVKAANVYLANLLSDAILERDRRGEKEDA